jgi:hypothetical protein
MRFAALCPGVAAPQLARVGEIADSQTSGLCRMEKENMDVSKFRRQAGSLPRRLSLLLGTGGLALGVLAASASGAAADRPASCSGSIESPGVLAGTYSSNVTVEGVCAVNAGPALIEGNLTLRPGAAVVAAFALNDHTGSGSSSLTVKGNLQVRHGATLLLGCDPQSFPCIDDPNPEQPTLSSPGVVSGNLSEQQPLGVVVHNSAIDGNVQETGGGGGLTCEPNGAFAAFGSPVYSDYEDSTVNGNLNVIGITSCWLGIARVHVGGNIDMIHNQLADPDAIEIISNHISGNLLCQQNSQVWDSADLSQSGLYPRLSEPNSVGGNRIGQCVLASPATEGGPSGPGSF